MNEDLLYPHISRRYPNMYSPSLDRDNFFKATITSLVLCNFFKRLIIEGFYLLVMLAVGLEPSAYFVAYSDALVFAFSSYQHLVEIAL